MPVDPGTIAAILAKVPEAIKTIKDITNFLDSDRAVVCTLENHSDLDLQYKSSSFGGGNFVNDYEPPHSIPAGQAGIWSAKDSGFMTGTNGSVYYWVPNFFPPDDSLGPNIVLEDDLIVQTGWNNPFAGGNGVTGWTYRPMTVANYIKTGRGLADTYYLEAFAGAGKIAHMKYRLYKRS